MENNNMIRVKVFTEEEQDELKELQKMINASEDIKTVFNLVVEQYKIQTGKEEATVDAIGDFIEDVDAIFMFLNHRVRETVKREGRNEE